MRTLAMRFALMLLALLGANLAALRPAAATARISVDLTTQSMHIEADSGTFDFPISSARAGFTTPRGYFRPQKLVRMHYSKKYHNSPMPYSIFFRGGYAIHGTGAVSQLGRPASHGCVRLSPANAATLYHLVQAEGGRIAISGTAPGRTTMVASNHRHKHVHVAARHHAKLTKMAAAKHHSRVLAYASQHKPASFQLWLKTLPLR